MIRQQLIEILRLSEEQLKQDVILVKHPQHPEVFFLLLNKKANTFTHDFVRKIHGCLDIVEENEGKTALITTSLHPSIFSAGLDLNFLGPMIYFDRANFIMEFMRLLGRILGLSIPSIALINGHAIAGGFFLSMAHDWRVSRSEKGKINFALNEVKIGMYLPPGLNAVGQQKLNPQIYRDMVLTGRSVEGSTDGLKYGLVDSIEKEDEILQKTIEMALRVSTFGVDKDNFKKIKEEMNKTSINACMNMQMSPGVRVDHYGSPKSKL